MGFRERIAKWISPGVRTDSEVRSIIQEEITRAKAALPITANYDPYFEGYRRMMGDGQLRDLYALDQDRMFEVAYFMWDHSPATRRLVRMDKSFLFAEPISVSSEDEAVDEVVKRFWTINKMSRRFPDKMMWLGFLGEQCWPVSVNPHNGEVRLRYVDPQLIKEVLVDPGNVEQPVRVDLNSLTGRPGQKLAVIRLDENPLSRKSYGRTVGECFFWALNHPPNSPRGRSDLLTLFDWVDAWERHGYNVLERSEGLLNFIWDVLLKGLNEDQIREWLQNNPAPEPGSLRAHNENVEWKAVTPDLKAPDLKAASDMAKSFIMGACGRPDSWFGGGGKAYETEAENFGQVPMKDLDERQQDIGEILEEVIQFVVDQAVIAGRLTEAQATAGFSVRLPEISKKDFSRLINGVPQLVTALSLAEQNRWIRKDTATRVFAGGMDQLGVEINADDEIKAAEAAAKKTKTDGPDVTEDYLE